MRLEELYRGKTPDLSVEFFPPQTPEGRKNLQEAVRRLKRIRPAFFSMTYGAGGSTRQKTFELCDWLKNREGVETTCHLNIVGQSRQETRRNLESIRKVGVYNLLALRGDPPRDQPDFKPHPEGLRASVELIQEARKLTDEKGRPWFSIAVTGFPEVHPEAKDRAADIAYLKRKIEAGGCVVITQFFLEIGPFHDFLERVRRAGITAPVVPGVLSIRSVWQLRKFAALCGAKIPPPIDKTLNRYEQDDAGAEQYGIELATGLCRELLKAGAPGLHFYALNRARSVEAILENLNLPASQEGGAR